MQYCNKIHNAFLLHGTKNIRNLKRSLSLAPHLLNSDTRRQLGEGKATINSINLEHTLS